MCVCAMAALSDHNFPKALATELRARWFNPELAQQIYPSRLSWNGYL